MPKPDKYPWMQFWTGEWLKDPELSLCTPATRGVWIDLICRMHELSRSGQLRGTADQLARAARCSTAELVLAMNDLQATGAADVTERNGVYTVTNRRMSRDARKRQGDATRQFRKRSRESHGDVTPAVTPPLRGRSQKSESENISTSPSSCTSTQEDPFAELAAVAKEVFDPDGDPWHGIERSLRNLGVGDSANCIATARASGCSPELVGMLIGHYEAFPQAWGPNYLYTRIRQARPGDDPTKLWPPMSAEWHAAQEAKKPPRALGPSREQQIAENAAKLAAAEAVNGPAVDAMSADEVRPLLNRFLLDRFRRGDEHRQPGAIREFLLLKAAQNGVSA